MVRVVGPRVGPPFGREPPYARPTTRAHGPPPPPQWLPLPSWTSTWSPTHFDPQPTSPTPQPPPDFAHPRAPAYPPRPHPPPPPGFPARPTTANHTAPPSPDPTGAATPTGTPAPTLLDRLFDYEQNHTIVYPSCRTRDLLLDECRPNPSDGETRHSDTNTTDDDDPPHNTDSLAFLDLFLERDLGPRREMEILEDDLCPSSHARDPLIDEYSPDPRDGKTRHRDGDPSTTDDDDPPHNTDSLAFLDLFLEKDLSPRREKEILEEYLLK